MNYESGAKYEYESYMNDVNTKQRRETEKIRSFTDLHAWQQGHRLVVDIYAEAKQFPADEQFGLSSQIKRSAVSVTSNIAEGFGRQGGKEKVMFFYHAHGSLTELKNQLLIARDVGYITTDTFDGLAEQANRTHELLRGLIRGTQKWRKRNS